MANLKNITELPVAESADGLNLIVNDNGAAKQISASAIEGKVKTINNIEPDTNGNIQIDTVSSWNDLKDKPFWVEEKKTLLGECSDECHSIPINIVLEEGKQYTFIINGIEHTATCEFESPDLYVPIKYKDTDVNIWVYEFTINFGNSFDFSTPVKVELLEYKVIHKLDAKYLPDPFWVEEKKTLVVEGMSDNGLYLVESQLEEGKEYVYCIDGIDYTGKAYLEAGEIYVNLEDSQGNTVCYVYDYGNIVLSRDYFDFSVPHKIELVEQVYHTHHDFMIINKFNEDTGERNAKVVTGDFASAKAKILKGLPATAYVCSTIYGDEWEEVLNFVTEVSYYHEDNGVEVCALNGLGIEILPDNTID